MTIANHCKKFMLGIFLASSLFGLDITSNRPSLGRDWNDIVSSLEGYSRDTCEI